MNTNFTGEVGHPDRPTDRPGCVPHLGGGVGITGQSFCSCDLALLRNRGPNTEVVLRTVSILTKKNHRGRSATTSNTSVEVANRNLLGTGLTLRTWAHSKKRF